MTMRSIVIPCGEKQLAGVVHEPAAANGKVLVLCHGFRGSKEGGGRAVFLAEQARMKNFTVVRFDFTPTECVTNQIQEIRAVVVYCRAILGQQIILLGRSLGGSASLAFAADDGKLTGLCLWSTPCDLHETFRLALGNNYQRLAEGRDIQVEDEYGKLELSPHFIADFDCYDLVTCVQRISGLPLLVLHGGADAVVHLQQADTLFRHAGEPKKMVVIDGADHQFSQHATQATEAVIAWLETFV
ncbi:MAG: Serine aminopeptidase [Firmicutes bacterium]|nr:Serine aminopeptidase [Bacillota bacterium]